MKKLSLQKSIGLLFVGLVFSLPVFAQTNDTINADSTRTLEEVVVTATRVSKPIIDIPYSVVRLNFANIKFERKVGAVDVMSGVPGLFLQSRYGDHDVRFSIRGFGSRSNSGIRGVRILLDDMPESEPDGQTRIEAIDFNALGRIEIVKGNASSLYTNAPGGVVNFFNDIDFEASSASAYDQVGSFGLHRGGFKSAIRTPGFGFLTAYSYQSYDGYRSHSNEYWHILNMVVETKPSTNTKLKILGYYVDGVIKLPGSLTREEFEKDPWQADPRSISRDEKRITTKGRIGIRYNVLFGNTKNNEIEITGFGSVKYFERTAKDYRIINRNVFGLSVRYVNKMLIAGHRNEFSVGTDNYSQPARTEYYENVNGKKGDQIQQLLSENITNTGFYFSENFEILKKKLFVLLTGRYDNIAFTIQEETLPSRTDTVIYNAFTPKIALNYKISPYIAIYTSYGLSFDSPANNELDSFDPAYLFNSDLQAQESQNFEIGIKGNLNYLKSTFLRKNQFDITFFNINIENEIVPLEYLGDVFYRNAAKTNRMGLEAGIQSEIIKDLRLTLSYTYSNFNYKKYLAKTIEADSTGNFITSEKDFSGNIVPSVPKNNLYVALTYSKPVISQITALVKLSYMNISGMWVDDANSEETKGYSLVNSLVGFDMKFWKFNILLSGGVNNIFDVVYAGFTNTNSANRRFYEAGAPRDFFVSLNLGFQF